jgi:hypothetical protein
VIERLHPYAELKRTVLPWLPAIPAHSEARQVTDLALVNRTKLHAQARVAEFRRQPRLARG